MNSTSGKQFVHAKISLSITVLLSDRSRRGGDEDGRNTGNTQAMTWGPENNMANVDMTVKRVKATRQRRSTTIAANLQSFICDCISSSIATLSVSCRNSASMSVRSRTAGMCLGVEAVTAARSAIGENGRVNELLVVFE